MSTPTATTTADVNNAGTQPGRLAQLRSGTAHVLEAQPQPGTARERAGALTGPGWGNTVQLEPPEERREAQREAPRPLPAHRVQTLASQKCVKGVVLAHSTRGTGQTHAASTAQPSAKSPGAEVASRPGARSFIWPLPLNTRLLPSMTEGSKKSVGSLVCTARFPFTGFLFVTPQCRELEQEITNS